MADLGDPRRAGSRSAFLARRLALVLLAPLAFLALAEGSLALAGFEVARYTGLKTSARYWIPYAPPGGQPGFDRAFPRHHRQFPEALPLFVRDKPPNGWRVFVLGESSVQGLPYEIGSFSDWLRVRLRAMLPDRAIEVVNAGNAGWHATEIRSLLQESLEHQPDALVWMVGHNEFVPQNVLPLRRERNHPLLEGVRRALFNLRVTQALGLVVPSLSGRRIVLHDRLSVDDLPCFTNELDLIQQRYREALAGAVDDARKAGVPIVLCTLARNVRESPPSGSYFSEACCASPQVRARWDDAYAQGMSALAQKLPTAALESLRNAQQIDDTPAKLHFALGRALEMAERNDEARAEFVAALEHDSCPMRAQAWVETAIRDVARETATPLADIERLFDRGARLGLSGDELVCDNVHPSLAGHECIAEEILKVFERDLHLPLDRSRDVTGDAARDAIGLTNYTSALAAREERRSNVRLVLESGAADELWTRTIEACRAVVRADPTDWEVTGDLGLLEAIGGSSAEARAHIEAAFRGDVGLRVNYLVGYRTARPYQNALDRAGIDMEAIERALSSEEQVVFRNRLGRVTKG